MKPFDSIQRPGLSPDGSNLRINDFKEGAAGADVAEEAGEPANGYTKHPIESRVAGHAIQSCKSDARRSPIM